MQAGSIGEGQAVQRRPAASHAACACAVNTLEPPALRRHHHHPRASTRAAPHVLKVRAHEGAQLCKAHVGGQRKDAQLLVAPRLRQGAEEGAAKAGRRQARRQCPSSSRAATPLHRRE